MERHLAALQFYTHSCGNKNPYIIVSPYVRFLIKKQKSPFKNKVGFTMIMTCRKKTEIGYEAFNLHNCDLLNRDAE